MTKHTNHAGMVMLKKFSAFCDHVDSEYSRAVSHDIKMHGALRALKRSPPQPRDYSDAKSFGVDWMVYNYLKKYPGLPGSRLVDRVDNAIRSWEAAELKCAATNGRVKAYECGYSAPLEALLPARNTVSVVSVILLAQQKIRRILGPFNEKLALAECRWSSGATLDHKRGTTRAIKMTSRLTVTAAALPLLRKVLRRDIHWSAAVVGCEPVGPLSLLDEAFSITDHNRHQTVPKTAYTERSIGIEPTGNAFLQQGVGRYLRRRLKYAGVDLDDQSLSQQRAADALRLGLCTLDLESASDTVSRCLVHLLLPVRWFQFLDKLRSPITRLADGRMFLLEKFSSMGNAFTFELESLIFYALASAVSELTAEEGRAHLTTVYGDDIIVPAESGMALKAVLEICGFAINESKSFFDGPFYESCGKHYFNGEDVTPAVQDSLVRTVPEQIRAYNRVVRWNVRISASVFRKDTACLLSGFQHNGIIMPYCEEGDEAFIVPIGETGSLRYCKNHGYQITGYVNVIPVEEIGRHDAAYAYKLRRPSHLNEHPKGYPGRSGHETFRLMQIWRSGDKYTPI